MSPEMKKQLKEIAGMILALGILEAGVCALIARGFGPFFLRCLAGDAAGCAVAFFGMLMLAVSIERAVEKSEKAAQTAMSGGYLLRLAAVAVFVFAVIKLPKVFNVWAAVVPLIFPRLAIMLINLKNGGEGK